MDILSIYKVLTAVSKLWPDLSCFTFSFYFDNYYDKLIHHSKGVDNIMAGGGRGENDKMNICPH